MSTASDAGADTSVEAAVALAATRVEAGQVEVVQEFIRRYYAATPPEDLADREPEDLYGAALGHWKFALGVRKPGTPRVRAYHPRLEHHGWQSSHSVVEIVTDDMPFLIDSVQMLLNERGLTTHLIIHPYLQVRRDADGRFIEALAGQDTAKETIAESLIHVEIDAQPDQRLSDELVAAIEAVLANVRAAVEDWQPTCARLAAVIAEFETNPPPLNRDEIDEAVEFLKWIEDHHFTFLGFREYELSEGPDGDVLTADEDSALGLFRGMPGGVSESFARLPNDIRTLAREPSILIITKANTRSTVHRAGHLDYIGVKRFDDAGRPVGERRFLGLYTSAAYNRNPRNVPLLRHKLSRVMQRSGYRPNTHDAKNLLNILESFPRDLLFQITDDALFDTAVSIVQLQERKLVRLFVHADRYRRFVSCIVYVPRDRFNTQIRRSIQSYLGDALNGTVADFTVNISESMLARLYYVFHVRGQGLPEYDIAAMQARLDEMTRAWSDELRDALVGHFGEQKGLQLLQRYADAFRADYRETYSLRIAVHDIGTMESLGEAPGAIALNLYQPLETNDNPLRLKLIRADKPIPLFETLPMLENMGLQVEDEHPSRIDRANASQLWLHDFGMDHGEGPDFDILPLRERFQHAFERIWHRDVENDRFNGLVLRAGLDWREIVVLRACAKYLRQAGTTFSHDYMAGTLLGNPGITQLLVELFHRRFDPSRENETPEADAISAAIDTALDDVPNLDDDRILRRFRELIMAMLRTNFYQTDEIGGHRKHLSFKFDPSKIAELPEPRPMFEIFVYSPRVEGVHLRGGRIARGGLRWSDRREDFRTEVLGLVKAQMVKNAVIVPVGSKGGFFPKQLPSGDREAIQAEGIACYETFIRGLLDVTDNLVGGKVMPAPQTVRYDGDDPYLVVAADKGTATFSDIANGIAQEYGFWLGDAFASGGSRGYDHKAMGITARGAWESVKRHFRELGLNTQTTDFTVAGIGDMAGDVFGNGMLLSEHIRLVAAFNHMHIFIDPDPDAAASHAERKRLFELPRSSWDDYDRGLLSSGGGIWPRTAKSIALPPEARALLGIDADALPPNELVQAILRAPVDLLWNGGIGTYVKSSEETHDEVGDRANDAVRIDADELHCRVIGEGGNLGITQRARIEFAMLGGRANTDAIDNSAGVDCSDHEVNLKILLNDAVGTGDMTDKQRNELLARMTDEVAALVLRNNYLQTQALSIAGAVAPSMLELHARFAQVMQHDGELDRELECLPDDDEIAARLANQTGFTSPELAVLLAYAKNGLYADLLESSVPDDPSLEDDLRQYFPVPVREREAARIARHRLAREITSTVLANEIVNRCGITFAYRLNEVTGAEPDAIARAYLVARDVFDMPGLWTEIESLDNAVPATAQIQALNEGQNLIERVARWLLRNRPQPLDISGNIATFSPGARLLAENLVDLVPESLRERLEEIATNYEQLGLPEAVANRIAAFDEMFSVLDIVEVSHAADLPVLDVASVYFDIGTRLELGWMRDKIAALPQDNRWRMLARAAMREDLYAQARVITADVLKTPVDKGDPQPRIERWLDLNAMPLKRLVSLLGDLQVNPRPDFAMLSVALRELRALRQSPPSAATRSQNVSETLAGEARRTGTT